MKEGEDGEEDDEGEGECNTQKYLVPAVRDLGCYLQAA